MNKRILARKDGKILVHQDVKIEVGGAIFKREEYMIWTDEEKMRLDIAAEIVGNSYRVYCQFISLTEIENEIVEWFLKN